MSCPKIYTLESAVVQCGTTKKAGLFSPAFLFVSFLKSADDVFKNNFLQPVDRCISLQNFSRERVAVGVSDVTAITVRRHEGIV